MSGFGAQDPRTRGPPLSIKDRGQVEKPSEASQLRRRLWFWEAQARQANGECTREETLTELSETAEINQDSKQHSHKYYHNWRDDGSKGDCDYPLDDPGEKQRFRTVDFGISPAQQM